MNKNRTGKESFKDLLVSRNSVFKKKKSHPASQKNIPESAEHIIFICFLMSFGSLILVSEHPPPPGFGRPCRTDVPPDGRATDSPKGGGEGGGRGASKQC